MYARIILEWLGWTVLYAYIRRLIEPLHETHWNIWNDTGVSHDRHASLSNEKHFQSTSPLTMSTVPDTLKSPPPKLKHVIFQKEKKKVFQVVIFPRPESVVESTDRKGNGCDGYYKNVHLSFYICRRVNRNVEATTSVLTYSIRPRKQSISTIRTGHIEI